MARGGFEDEFVPRVDIGLEHQEEEGDDSFLIRHRKYLDDEDNREVAIKNAVKDLENSVRAVMKRQVLTPAEKNLVFVRVFSDLISSVSRNQIRNERRKIVDMDGGS